VAKKRISDDSAGFTVLTEMLAAAGDSFDDAIPIAIETPRGLLVAALRATGRPVFAINPLAVARYRERHSVAGAKSDHADAMTLANILRVDSHLHRRMPADSELAQAIAVLARAQQDAVWRRSKASNELRSMLREYYPAFLDTFAGKSATNLAKPEARAVLAIAPTPAHAAKLIKTRVAAALRRAGRKRGIDGLAVNILEHLQAPQLRQPELVEKAMGRQALALLAMLDAACTGADELAQTAAEEFRKHPDYAVITSFPGLADLTGARVLAEIGDDRDRFADDRAAQDPRQQPGPPARSRPSPTAGSKTTASPPSAGFGPPMPTSTPAPLKTTTADAETTATATPPPCDTCSIKCSASCTTACKPAKPSTRSKPSDNHAPHPANRQRLDS